MNREEIGENAKKDLEKPILQLLTDAHEELLKETFMDERSKFIHGFKRFASYRRE
jgi:hypothetical protein